MLDQGLSIFDAIKKAVEILEGAYSFVLISILDPEAMFVVKNTGTMVIGFPESLAQKENEGIQPISDMSSSEGKLKEEEDIHKFQIVSSDTTVFQDYTKQYYNIEDKETIKLSLNDKIDQARIKSIKEGNQGGSSTGHRSLLRHGNVGPT